MTAALRTRIEELEEEIRQLKAAFAPKVGFPFSWKLDARESAILSALFHGKGSYISNEAILLLIAGFDEDVGDSDVRAWMGRLRRKVQPLGIEIVTRHMQGYQLDPDGAAVVARALGAVLPIATVPTEARPAHPRGWTEAEDQAIRAGYGRSATLAVIRVELIGAGFRARSLGSISTRAQMLGFTNSRKGALWTPDEDAILREGYESGLLFSKIRLKLAEAGFNRNRSAIGMRLISLGLSGERVRTWTRPELAIIRAGIEADHSYVAIREALRRAGFERGRSAVYKQAVSMAAERRADPPWTNEDVALLYRRYAEKVPQRTIAEELGRGVGAIATKASKLGLKQRFRWTEAERDRLRQGFEAGECLAAVCRDIDRPSVNVAAEAKRMGLQFAPMPRRAQIRDLAA
ncbi:helix-turn-helix domain-containing protein [Methylobacterium sp. J-070]|uniref:winged helix-turn-helix domain-containing protein n=1 Tax=Methylobacterium sp. J-070 TaxID=2836650 RepID=UPI001FB8D5D8|nr:helix-turn-helix domain-containing protein [Methylobacterium sp. J-070]MCJ2051673.1 winged helix-turn-helix domain-containing protein [Methylobacterium sp. J-070]